MRPPIDAPEIAARIAAGEDLSPADEAAWLDYLEQNPGAAVELDEQLAQLRRLAPSPGLAPPEVADAEWSALFERIGAAVGPEAGEAPPTEATEPPRPESSEPEPPRLPIGGLFMTALLLLTAGLIAFQLRGRTAPLPADPVQPPQSPATTVEAPPFIGPLPEDDGGPDIEIEDLQVREDIQATLRLPLKRGSFTLIRLRKKPR